MADSEIYMILSVADPEKGVRAAEFFKNGQKIFEVRIT